MKNSPLLEPLFFELNEIRDLFSSRKFQPKNKSIKREICHRYGSLIRLHLASNKFTDRDDFYLHKQIRLFIDMTLIEAKYPSSLTKEFLELINGLSFPTHRHL